MTDFPDAKSPDSAPGPATRSGLRLRLWLGCLGAALTSAAGFTWLLASGFLDGGASDSTVLVFGIGVVVAASFLVGVTLAAWLDHGIVGRLRSLLRGAATGQVETHRGSPAGADWGELLELTHRLQSVLSRQRQLAATAQELQDLQRQVTMTRTAIDSWIHTERWESLPEDAGVLSPVIETLNRSFARSADVHEQNREAASQIRDDLAASVDDAREASGAAERSFVDATALLTTVRELQRLGEELSRAMDGMAESAAGDQAHAYDEWRTAAVSAIEELVTAAGESVNRLAEGLMRVEEIAAQVNLLSNRATLISLNVVVGQARGESIDPPNANLAEELKRLVHEVQAATERVDELSQAISQDVQEASERMRGVRERVAVRLEQNPTSATTSDDRKREDTQQLLGRVREMVQDAAQKSERLSATGESASRAAARLARELEDEVRDLEGLVVRLSPPGEDNTPDPQATVPQPTHEMPSDSIRFPEQDIREPRHQGERS